MCSSMAGEISHYLVDGRRSGYTYLSAVTQQSSTGLSYVPRNMGVRWQRSIGRLSASPC